MSSQVIEGWKPIRGTPGKTIVTQNSDGSYTVTIDPSAIGDGSGDMLKAVYDIDGNGSVDAAESVPWGGVTDKPLVFPPDEHTHSGSDVTSQVSSAASADFVPWAGVTDKPLVFPPDAHTHDDRYYTESEIGTLLGGYVLKSTFDANTILKADTDDTPVALTVGASTIVGRKSTGGIAALSAGDARTVLGLETTDTVQFAKIGVGIAPNFNLIFTTESSSVKSWLGGLGSGAYDAIAGFQYAGTTSQVEFLGIHSRGTIASPAATQSGDSLFLLSGKGYQGAAYTARRAYIRIVAEDNYSSGAQGAGFAFATTAAGGTTRSEKIVFTGAGSIGVNTTSPTISDGVGVDINGKILRLRNSKMPASASDTGNVGEICWDSNYVYVAVGTNQWKRAALSTW